MLYYNTLLKETLLLIYLIVNLNKTKNNLKKLKFQINNHGSKLFILKFCKKNEKYQILV